MGGHFRERSVLMSETKFDVTLKAWMERSVDRLKAVAPKTDDPHGQKALELAVDLLEGRLVPYSAAVSEALAEGEEAARAAEDVARAEVKVEAAYERLYATAQANYYLAVADAAVDAALLKERMDRGIPLPPSGFRALGIDRTRSVMGTALGYAEEALGAEHPAVLEAKSAYEAFSKALKVGDSEKADAVRANQKLFAARDAARQAYVAARQFVDAALALNADESIRQLMPGISTMYDARQPIDGELADPATPVADDDGAGDAPSADPAPAVTPVDA